MSAERELLPCPFCGGAAKLYGSNTLFGVAIAGWFVECSQCGVSGQRSEFTDSGASVISAWNRRAYADRIAADEVLLGQAAEALKISAVSSAFQRQVLAAITQRLENK